MFNYSKKVMASSIAGLVLAGYGGEFTLKKADHDLLLKNRTLEWEMSASSLQDIQPQTKLKVPEGMIEPKLKYFSSSKARSFQLLMYKSSKAAKTFDRVIVDQAANRDFTDDPVLTFGPELPVDVKWQPKGREAADYRIYLVSPPFDAPRRGWDVAFLPMLWREGTVTLEGKPVRAVKQNIWAQPSLVIDSDGDGQLNPQPCDWVQVATYVKINNAFYKTVLRKSDNDLDLEPFNGPFGKLVVTGEMLRKGSHTLSLEVGRLEGAAKYDFPYAFLMEAVSLDQSIAIPAGEYSHLNGSFEEKRGMEARFNVEKFIIRPDQVTTLNLGNPKAELAVLQEDRTLSVNRELVFAGNPTVTYSMEPEGESKDKPLTVDVVDATDPTKVIVGRTNMEYG